MLDEAGAVVAIRHCIDRCRRATDARSPAQLERRLAERLARTGDARIAQDVAAAARRLGDWLAKA